MYIELRTPTKKKCLEGLFHGIEVLQLVVDKQLFECVDCGVNMSDASKACQQLVKAATRC